MVMVNEALVSPPANPLQYKGDRWYPPEIEPGHRNLWVPKRFRPNLEYRKRLREACQRNGRFQASIRLACSKSPLYWMNAFAWTYRAKVTCPDGRERSAGTAYTDEQGVDRRIGPPDTPLITWPAQDHYIDQIHRCCLNGGLVLGDKSRDQGATVLVMTYFVWALVFWPRFSAIVASRAADLVDGAEEDTLLGKADYVLSRLPQWMYDPKMATRKHSDPMLISYRGARIRGITANQNLGQSLRSNVILIDEAARFPYDGRLMKSIETVAACQIHISTPNGPGTQFSKLRQRADTAGGRDRISVATLGYWDHPQKGAGRKWTIDHSGSVTRRPGTGYWETPAFEVARLTLSPREWCENWLIDHETSGMLVLDQNSIQRLRRSSQPPQRGTLDAIARVANVFNFGGHSEVPVTPSVSTDEIMKWGRQARFEQNPRGELYVWSAPKPDRNYVIGGDFGQGLEQSNTVLAVMDASNGHIVAEFVSPTIAAHEAAPLAAVLGGWYGGDCGYAFQIWERNGPGIAFGHELAMRLRYPICYFQRREGARGAPRTTQWGWQSGRQTRELLFKEFDAALRRGEFHTPGDAMLDDMSSWIIDEYGRIVCGHIRDEASGAQARHGDRCIAAALAVLGRREAPRFRKSLRRRFKPGSFGHLMKMDQILWPSPEPESPFALDNRRKADVHS